MDLPPDPGALDSLGRNHTLNTAVADLVDNSIDAGASHILVRIVRRRTQLLGVSVVDDGRGIGPDEIDRAMTVGGRRDYAQADMGHFGIGLKAASFSQADNLTLFTRKAGHAAVGRRWVLAGDRTDFRCDLVSPAFAQDQLDRGWPVTTTPSGTVVRWDGIRAFPTGADPTHVDEFLDRTINDLRDHLGLVFHRLIPKLSLTITIDQEDTILGTGIPTHVPPLNPFAYPSTIPGYPLELETRLANSTVVLRCHLWPKRSNVPQFRLPGGAEERQGLYFYRRDRLLQGGGWQAVHAPDPKLQLARVEVDIDGDLDGFLRINPEKSQVSAGPLFTRAVDNATSKDGKTIQDYFRTAEETWIRSNQKKSGGRAPVLPPGKGFHPRIVEAVKRELPQVHRHPLNLKWKPLTDDRFFDIDRDAGTLWLNQAYRRSLLGGRHGGPNDLPIIKTLMFLLTQDLFQGAHHGPRDRDNIDLWQSLLTAAAMAERSTFEARN